MACLFHSAIKEIISNFTVNLHYTVYGSLLGSRLIATHFSDSWFTSPSIQCKQCKGYKVYNVKGTNRLHLYRWNKGYYFCSFNKI